MNGSKQEQERELYVTAFNSNMVKIWREKISHLNVFETGELYRSVAAAPVDADGKFRTVLLRYNFREYGIYQDRGTGREVYKGNSGDIGRPKVRERRKWFSPKFYGSMMNLREFYADNLGEEFCNMCASVLKEKDGGVL